MPIWNLDAFMLFNKKVMEDLRNQRMNGKVEWERDVYNNWNLCLECGESLDLHRDGKCPTIIDAEFVKEDNQHPIIKEEQPLLPSGKG